MQAVNFREREQPRTDWQRQRGTSNRRRLTSDSCTGSCGEAGARTRSCCQIRGVESEADMFDQYL